LGVVATDVNNDGRTDLFVANDTVQNFLFVNRGAGPKRTWRWRRSPCRQELALAKAGRRAPAWRRFCRPGGQRLAGFIWSPTVDHEMFSLYHNNKDETFQDVAQAQGVARSTRLLSGWGLKYFDYDNDGAVDLFLRTVIPTT